MSDETQAPETETAETPATEATSTPETPETPEKSKRQMSFAVLDSGLIQANFGPGLDPVTLNPAEVPEAIQAAAVTEGLISRARGYTSRLTEENRTPEKLREAIVKAFAQLMAGVWKVERDGIAGAEISIEAEAAYLFKVKKAEAKGETFAGTMAEAVAAFSALTDDQKKQLKELPRYKVCYAEVRAKRALENVKKLEKAAAASEAEDAPF